MHKFLKLWNLQLFAEGASAGEGGDGGAATGATTADAAQDGMENLGIPKEKLERYRASKAKRAQAAPVQEDEPAAEPETQPTQAAAAAQEEEQTPDYDAEWDKITKNPEYNKRIQDIVGNRVKGMKAQLADLAPVLETLGQKYGMDVTDLSKMDFKALAEAVNKDDSYFEDAAADLGSSSATARRVWEAELAEKRKDLTAREEMESRHEENLRQQAAAFSQKLPGFDLAREMMNPQFARMVGPGGGFSVEQAFNAVHHDAIVSYEKEMAAKQALKSVSNAVKSGKSMPVENGSVPRAASESTTKLYSQMTPQERQIWLAQKKREAAGHGR